MNSVNTVNVHQATSFEVKVIEANSELQNLNILALRMAHRAQSLERKSTESKTKQIFQDNYKMMCCIANSIEDKVDSHLSQKYRIVAAYDSKHHIPQALGIINPDFEYNGKKCSELLALATAYWNIESPLNVDEPHRVRGAGRAIVKYCSEVGKNFGSAGEVYLKSLGSAIGYYKDILGFRISDKQSIDRITPMFLNAYDANEKLTNELEYSNNLEGQGTWA